jgi:quinol monooxygenase YgiN
MIIRIVKLTFRPEESETFKKYFVTVDDMIRNQPGCQLLQAWQARHQPNIFFTYSLWDSEEDLNNYRASEFFGIFWKTVKPWFGEKAETWTFDKITDK